ncbi:TetR/AcrR family transcriptional regulator [Streptomyces yaizuensis]|uniref:TetR/AcrR family transcriptional regulator n=2 Tax=Streptomyces yaizuensis TaxID=2989713 RepID=A0ABQ5NYX2_9ACTN|nr:TetR/AcrR family transcriptional regulator [Streptomyces sp. YSPA8]
MRRRSRDRLLQATVDLVGERGYEATTLADIADRAGAARGLVSYYFPGKRQLLQSAVHRLMHRTLESALWREPRTEDGRELLARAIDAVLGLAADRPVLMRTHMSGILQAEGFIPCPEQHRVAALLRWSVERSGSRQVDTDYPLLRALLMGAVFAIVLPGAPMPAERMRADLFQRFGLGWELGVPPGDKSGDKSGGKSGGESGAGPPEHRSLSL